MKIRFLGGAGTVTGSKYLVEHAGRNVLVDCGLFQGYKNLRLRNWAPLPFDAAGLAAAVLTHAHLDHSGALPLLMRQGFRGAVHTSAATIELCQLLLPDSGHIQEEDAAFANRHHSSKHEPALPLYTAQEARDTLPLLAATPFDAWLDLMPGLRMKLRPAGHILGAASVLLESEGCRVLFSGDIGRPDDPVMRPAADIEGADFIVVESTYGDCLHDPADVEGLIGAAITRTVKRGGTVVVPSFAVGRAQALLQLHAGDGAAGHQDVAQARVVGQVVRRRVDVGGGQGESSGEVMPAPCPMGPGRQRSGRAPGRRSCAVAAHAAPRR